MKQPFVSLLVCLAALRAGAQATADLPPVDVPLPDPAPAESTSAVAKDPTAVSSTVTASAHAGEAKETAELLAPLPGLTVQDGGGTFQRKSLVVRGASSSGVLVLLDGVPLAAPGQAVDLSRVPAALVDRLEVVRGASGARFGPGGLGGVVNVVTRRPGARPFLWTEASQGSFWTTQVNTGGAAAFGDAEVLAAAHFGRSQGDFPYRFDDRPELDGSPLQVRTRENNDGLQSGGLLRLRARAGGFDLDALAEGQGGTRGLAGTVENPSPDARQDFGRGLGALRASRALGTFGLLELSAWGRGDRDHFRGAGFPQGLLQTSGGVGGELAWSALLFDRHAASVQVGGGGDWLEAGAARASWGRFSATVADEVLLFGGRASIAGAVRVDQTGPFTGFSPRLGAVAYLPWGLEVRANVGQAHRPPSFQELYLQQGTLAPNAALRPERGLYADGAVGWVHPRARVQVAGFYSLYEDLITYEYYPPQLAKPYNFQAARVAGLEAEAFAEPAPWVSLGGSYTFLSTQNLKDDPRYYLKELPYRPRHKVGGRLALGPSWLRAHADLVWQSAQTINRSATVSLPERALLAVGATARPVATPEVRVSLEVKNLLDVQGQDFDGYPLPPRAAYLTVAVAWDAARTSPNPKDVP